MDFSLTQLLFSGNFLALNWGNLVMISVGLILISLAIVKEYERVFRGRSLYQEDRYLTHYEVELTRIFYIWLYYEQYDNDFEPDNNV